MINKGVQTYHVPWQRQSSLRTKTFHADVCNPWLTDLIWLHVAEYTNLYTYLKYLKMFWMAYFGNSIMQLLNINFVEGKSM